MQQENRIFMIRRFEPSRALEVIHPKYGSGYRIGGRLVLTVSHILDEVNSVCRVRAKRSFGEVEATVRWKSLRADIALIQLPERIQPFESAAFGLLPKVEVGEKLSFQMYGYPKWGRTRREDGVAAGGRQVEGIIYLADTSPDELLVLEALRRPEGSLDSGSDWEGNSGAAIVCDGLIVAVLRQHQNPERSASLEAVPLCDVYNDDEWNRLLREQDINLQPQLLRIQNKTTGATLAPRQPELEEQERLTKTKVLDINFESDDMSTYFVGREKELQSLEDWILKDRCKLIAILGMGGVGKSALSQMSLGKAGIGKSELSRTLSKNIESEFTYVIYVTLKAGLPFKEFIARALNFLSNQQKNDLPDTLDSQIEGLIEYFRKYRCLLVIDNVETILKGLGNYAPGCAGYGKLFEQVGRQQHQSCLLLNSRENPTTIYELEGVKRPVRSLYLEGLDCPSVKLFFASIADNFIGSDSDWNKLVDFYAGNPLALNIVAKVIRSRYQGDISRFLREGEKIYPDIQSLLDWTFERLSEPELKIIYWLSINGESVPANSLAEDMLQSLPACDIEGLIQNTLDVRSLPVERSSGKHPVQYSLQPVLVEYTLNRLIKEIVEEIKSDKIDSLNKFCIVKATDKDYIKADQTRRIVLPISEQISLQEVDSKLSQIRSVVMSDNNGYAAGNLLNILLKHHPEIRGYDFSGLRVRQADLSNRYVKYTNFSDCDLSQSIFRESFSTIISIDFRNDYAIAGTASGQVHLWSFEDGKEECIRNYKAHADWVWALSFSPCGNYFASGGGDKQVKLWNVDSGDWIRVNVGHSGRVRSVVFSPDGKYLATGGEDRDIKLWNTHTSELEKVFRGHRTWANALAFSPDGSVLACGSQGTNVRFWNVSTAQQLHFFTDYPKPINRVKFSPNGKLFAICGDFSEVWLLDTGNWQCVKKLGTKSYKGRIRDISFNPDGQFILGCCADGVIRGWDINTGELYSLKDFSRNNKKPLRSIAFNSKLENQQILCGGEDQTLQMWDFSSLTCLKTIYGYTNPIWAVTFSPNNSLLVSGDEDHALRIWNFEQDSRGTEKIESDLLGTHENLVRVLSFSYNGSLLASGSYDGTVKIWDISSKKLINMKKQDENRDRVIGVAFHPTDPILAISYYYGEKVNIWDYETNELVHRLHLSNPNGEPTRARDVSFSPDGYILAISSEEHYIRLWNLQENRYLNHLDGHMDAVWSVSFNRDDGTLASCDGSGGIRIWNIKTGECRVLSSHSLRVRTIAFSPDNSYLVSGSDDKTLKIWDVKSGECIATLVGHDSWIWSASFSHDGLMVASGGDDQTIRIWDFSTGECLMLLKPERPYEGIYIKNAKGLTLSQKEMLITLGAVQD
ncbi:MAG: WD40 repeat protein [Phormidium sp. OSCR]|nr:MAG: WD40 repeat protein [Phormidium sp. OSCR]